MLIFLAAVAGCSSKSPPTDKIDSPSKVTLAYFKAIVASDWKAVCLTRLPSEREKMDSLGGSCEKSFENLMAGKPVGLFATLKVKDVRTRDDLASIDLVQPGQSKAVVTMVAKKVGEEWFLVDLPDGAGP